MYFISVCLTRELNVQRCIRNINKIIDVRGTEEETKSKEINRRKNVKARELIHVCKVNSN